MAKKKLTRAEKKAKQLNLSVEVAKPANFVAKYAREFNKATVETDRKKQAKRNGFQNTKHKGRNQDW